MQLVLFTFRVLLILVSLGLLSTGCGSSDPESTKVERDVFEIPAQLEQERLVKSSILMFEFPTTKFEKGQYVQVDVEGIVAGKAIHFSEDVALRKAMGSEHCIAPLPIFPNLWNAFNVKEDLSFFVTFHFAFFDELGQFAKSTISKHELRMVLNPAPNLTLSKRKGAFFPGQLLAIHGEHVLRTEEGTTWARILKGRVQYKDGSFLDIRDAKYPVLWKHPSKGTFSIHPMLFGIKSGHFKGKVVYENELRTGEYFTGKEEELDFEMLPPKINKVNKLTGSRGELFTISGHGFIKNSPVQNIGMHLVFEGVLTPSERGREMISYKGALALTRKPHRVVDETLLEQDVWTDINLRNRTLSGLGSVPGTFEGHVFAVLFKNNVEQKSESFPLQFIIQPTKQIVFLKYLPGFSKTVEKFGLYIVENEIKQRILAVLNRDYTGVNIEFRTTLPKDFLEFTTLEIGGTDPSGLANFGYDNSYNDGGKDVGNLYLNDYLGGVNKQSKDAGYLPYGGVFVESFQTYSPTLYPENAGTSTSFDRVLKPFMPALKGTPVRRSEWPQGSRVSAVQNAIDLLGNLTGHTASHEMGHALGLVFVPADVPDGEKIYHNDPPGENWIMDSGPNRSFAERAEVEGKGPAVFNAANSDYLRRILPRL